MCILIYRKDFLHSLKKVKTHSKSKRERKATALWPTKSSEEGGGGDR